MPALSVVLITKNQGWNVDRLVTSVLDECRREGIEAEVVLVDSASSDDTVERAQAYPISVVVLDADQRLTAAAGRYAGQLETSGELILFLDGDMQLRPGWLGPARALLDGNPRCAAVTGNVIDVPSPDVLPIRLAAAPGTFALSEVPHVGGAGMYRRSALARVGGFNPYLYSDEEPDLCLRLRQAGFRNARIDTPIAYHFSTPSDAISTLFARRRRRLYYGFGQNLRYLWGTDALPRYVRERGFGLSPAAALLAGLASLLASLASRRPGPALIWLLAALSAVSADAVRKRSVRGAVFSLVQRLLILEGTVRGLLLEPIRPDTVPLRYRVLQRSAASRGAKMEAEVPV